MARFQPGNNGGPGRPKGSKNKFQEQFWRDLANLWEQQGAAALLKVLNDDTSTFVRVAAGLLPKEEEHRHEITGVRWLTETEWLALSISPESNSEPTTNENSDTQLLYAIDGQVKH